LDRIVSSANPRDLSHTLASIDSLVRDCPDFAPGWRARGQLYGGLFHLDSATVSWEQYRRLDPHDWRVLPDLILTYQYLSDSVRRDECRASLFQMREEQKDPSLKTETEYLLDSFKIDSTFVTVYEQFTPTGDRQVYIYFHCTNARGRNTGSFSFGSYEQDNQFARELGQIREGEKVYHLDFNSAERHSTYGMYLRKPSYDILRAIVVGAIRGAIVPSSSSTSK
jgi:hypothetical protein